jgi:hypothetical protein
MFSNIAQKIPVQVVHPCKMFFVRGTQSPDPIDCIIVLQLAFLQRSSVSLECADPGYTA